jgi:23S rRNA (cytidine1920-2'-O)/16S rRNA (cytidine1409-2'-O)-methyltransferase
MGTKQRIDQLLMERGYASSRQKAQAMLIAGEVLVNEQKVEKPGTRVAPEADIRLLGELPFVSRAGGKLQAGLDHFKITVVGKICADLGASTGGFTDCLLKNGALQVHAFDVGKGQIAWKLRTDPRVVVHDGFNVRHISAADLPKEISIVTVDLSFISLTKILLPLKEALIPQLTVYDVDLVLLVKPQFEAGKGEVGKGGIIRGQEKQMRILQSVETFAEKTGYLAKGRFPSPILGAKGNREFLMYLQIPPSL